MRISRPFRIVFAAALLAAAFAARAQDAGDGTLHVLRPVIHAEQEDAEICLEFDHDLDAADREHIASLIRLEAGGRNIPIRAQTISITGNLLCVPSLEHRRDYRIVVNGARGSKGEKLTAPYGFSFTVPDRAPSLSFTGNAVSEGLARWRGDNPVLRAINVPTVHLELYRIADPDTMSAAWRDRQQTVLAPSESATFGRDHGKLIWSGDLALPSAPNKSSEREVPLAENVPNAQPGLYLIVARGPEVKPEPEPGEESDAKAAPLAPLAALWLLRSGLHLQALRDATGIYGIVEKTGAPTEEMPKNVRLAAEDANAAVLAEARSDESGVGFIALDAGKLDSAATLAGFTDAGDADFIDLKTASAIRFLPPKDELTLTSGKAFYAPAAQASVAFAAHDAQGNALAESGTVLALLGANNSTYEEKPVPSLAHGFAHMDFLVPAQEGVWPLVWRQGDRVLAGAYLRVTDDPAAPRLEIAADRQAIARDGDVNLTLKSLAINGAPAPYIAGRIFVAWDSPDALGSEWKGYHFGAGRRDAGAAAPVTSFVTDEKGAVTIHLALTPPDDRAALHDAIITLRGDPSAGVAMPPPLILPMRPKESVVGVKPLASEARFPENGFARFGVVALDADGHRRATDDLDYQIYEEGRSFDWYQADGRWNYKLEQQRRRIGGGALALGADGDDVIEWPVAAGIYRIEITDATGTVRAAADFSAGSGAPEESAARTPLALASSAASWRPGQTIETHFTLDKPSMMTALIGDDHIRKIIHRRLDAGDNMVSFTGAKDWSGPVSLDVTIETPPGAGRLVFPRATDESAAAKNETKTASGDALTFAATPPAPLYVGDTARFTLDIRNNASSPQALHYMVSATDLRVDGSSGAVTIPAGQTHRIQLGVTALHAGAGSIKLEVTGGAHLRMSHEWTLPVAADIPALNPGVRQRIEPQQSTSWPPEKGAGKTHAREESLLFLSPAPLYGASALLPALLAVAPFTTAELAATLEALRLWRGPITASGLMPEAVLDLHRRDLLLRLIARQRPDGGFASLPGDRPVSEENFVTTSRALVALAAGDFDAAKPAADRAAQWLQQRLANTWFDESERPARAAAYAALAAAGRLDNASLHYFSDTSAKTAMPMDAALDLAFAFALIGDQPASSFWIETSGAKKSLPDIPSALFPILAGNPFWDVSMLQSSLESASAAGVKNADIKSAADFLRAVAMIQNRKGAWRVTIGADKRGPKGILVMAVPPKTAPPVIYNNGDAPVFLSGIWRAEAKPAAAAARYIYRLNGTEMDAAHPLASGETYLVVLEGNWPGAGESILVHDNPAAGLRVTGCLPPPPIDAGDQLAWLKNQMLTIVAACDSGAGGIDMMLLRKESGSAASWRAAYMVKAEKAGRFNWPPATASHSNGGTSLLPLLKTPARKIEIR